MIRLYRGDVIEAYAPDGKGGTKPRPLVVYKDSKPEDTFIAVYCTTQNNGDEENTILVLKESEEAAEMGLDKDTYIRPLDTKPMDKKFFKRKIGKCPLLKQIDQIIDNNMSRR